MTGTFGTTFPLERGVNLLAHAPVLSSVIGGAEPLHHDRNGSLRDAVVQLLRSRRYFDSGSLNGWRPSMSGTRCTTREVPEGQGAAAPKTR
jgi:hypothetical protein